MKRKLVTLCMKYTSAVVSCTYDRFAQQLLLADDCRGSFPFHLLSIAVVKHMVFGRPITSRILRSNRSSRATGEVRPTAGEGSSGNGFSTCGTPDIAFEFEDVEEGPTVLLLLRGWSLVGSGGLSLLRRRCSRTSRASSTIHKSKHRKTQATGRGASPSPDSPAIFRKNASGA